LFEKIGDREYKLEEARLDVFDDVVLWAGNPRLLAIVDGSGTPSDDELEANLQKTPGYDHLRKSVADVGQLEPIYAWKSDGMRKYLVLEGATRVTILRELARKRKGRDDADQFRYVKAKILPPEFSEESRIILLARIHVRGSGVREWDRYTQARFIYENTTSSNGRPRLTISDMARNMQKSVSWVSRLRDAYEFAQQYVDYHDGGDAKVDAVRHFSILEEIIKASGFGPLLKGDTPDAEKLRAEVFNMVKHDVFQEYRDGRFMKQYYEDPDKWARLNSLERHIAHQVAAEITATGPSTIKGRIGGLYAQIQRAIDRDPNSLDDHDLEELRKGVNLLASHVAADVGAFRLQVQEFIKALHNVSLEEVKKITPEEYEALQEGIDDFRSRLEKHSGWMKAKERA
jgi:hypothetical protein